MPQVERPKWKERRPKTVNLKNYPWLCELLGTEKIVFPRGRSPESQKARNLRTNLSQYWIEGGLVFISRVRDLEGIDWKENQFQFKLKHLGKILGVFYNDLRRIRQALLVGRLMEKEEVGEEGVWAFTKEELLQLTVGAHVYPQIQRKYRRRKK